MAPKPSFLSHSLLSTIFAAVAFVSRWCTVSALWGFRLLASPSSYIRPATGLGALLQFFPSHPLAGSSLKGHLTSRQVIHDKPRDNHKDNQLVNDLLQYIVN